jgi:hypothetical protein
MIKKHIASILIILILINSIGCYSYNQIKIGNTKEFEKDDNVKITTLKEKVYNLHHVQIEGSELKGLSFNQFEGDVVIPTNQIKKIEVHEFSFALTSVGVILIIGLPLVAFALAWQYDELSPGD